MNLEFQRTTRMNLEFQRTARINLEFQGTARINLEFQGTTRINLEFQGTARLSNHRRFEIFPLMGTFSQITFSSQNRNHPKCLKLTTPPPGRREVLPRQQELGMKL